MCKFKHAPDRRNAAPKYASRAHIYAIITKIHHDKTVNRAQRINWSIDDIIDKYKYDENYASIQLLNGILKYQRKINYHY
jgi:hypothetical protein